MTASPVGAAISRQLLLQDNALLDLLDALDVGDLLGADLDEHLNQGVVLGVLQGDLQRALGDNWGCVLGRIRAG